MTALNWNEIWKEYDRWLLVYIMMGGDVGGSAPREKLSSIVEQHLKDWKH